MNKIKKKPLARAANSGVISDRTDKADNTTSLPVALNDFEIQELVSYLRPTSKQAIRFVRIVASNPDLPTNKCNRGAGGVNLSDIAIKYNPRLMVAGYYLACRRPPMRIKNEWGEDSGQVYWGLYLAAKKVA